jgi:hypothetical protein
LLLLLFQLQLVIVSLIVDDDGRRFDADGPSVVGEDRYRT